MNFVDVVIIICCIVAGYVGWRNGAVWVGTSAIALVIGIVVGALVAPAVANILPPDAHKFVGILAGFTFLLIAFVIQGTGATIGVHLKRRFVTSFSPFDAAGGALIAAATCLVITWFIGITLADSQWPAVDSAIDSSVILRTLSDVAPTPPSFFVAFEAKLNSSAKTSPFATVIPEVGPYVQLPTNIDTQGVLAAQDATGKIYSFGCPEIEAGSTWPIAPHYYVTNAHVVAGSSHLLIQLPDGSSWKGTVVYYDPDEDIALIYVKGSDSSGLPVYPGTTATGTLGAMVGYPHGNGEETDPAAVRGSLRAVGFNLYKTTYITRTILDVEGDVLPGDSGGPLVDLNGTVIGVVFARSSVTPDVGYALPTSAFLSKLRGALGSHAAASTGSCLPS